ncbi:hypothetical protein BC827DRAFT_1175936 [Russula dissimulans]|nr:hypothetical protein BC827DRAFT_1175936 [Russula dissimulans]
MNSVHFSSNRICSNYFLGALNRLSRISRCIFKFLWNFVYGSTFSFSQGQQAILRDSEVGREA